MSEGNRKIARRALSRRPESSPRAALGLAALAFRKYAPALHRYIERRMRRPGSALDLTQDIFERFLQIKEADAVRNPQAYLYGIASHVVREALFREDKSLVTYDSDAAEEAGGRLDQALPDDMAERLSLQQDLKRALGALPTMHRVVLLLVKRDGLSYEEAALKTRLSVSTVTNYVFEARARVKMLLKDRAG
jgi:RNA polymerase sigma factor (sigma-70 family)